MAVLDSAVAARRLYAVFSDALRTGDLARFDAVVSLEVADHDLEPRAGSGLAGMKAAFAGFAMAFSDVRFDVLDIVASGNKAACRVAVEATHRGPFMGMAGTGRRVRQEGIDILVFSGGLLVERWGHFDDVGLARQLGLALRPR